ncbi:BatE protein [Patiriisocius marinus]|uniref:BatE protein n=2 Tax=Patiriisocius marinus TaxID=1397112 RepID=A0A5J4J1Z5_9FLAO|nr:BatE protein [Patiriisocius marinus]
MSIFGQNDALFEKGKEQYKTEQYADAIVSWKKILDAGEHSEAVYFNLGNAYYKLNKIGPSIYYYEKALQLDPDDKDVLTNLAFAENARIDAIEPLPKTIFSKWYASIANLFTFDGWAKLAILFIFLFVISFLLYYFGTIERRKRSFFIASMMSVFLFCGALTLAYLTSADVEKDVPAIIFTESVEIKSAPKMNSATAFILHEGTKVQVEALDGDWLKIVIADGKDGWIPATDLKKL